MKAIVKSTKQEVDVIYDKNMRKWYSHYGDEELGVMFYNRNDLEFLEDNKCQQ